MSTAYSPNVTKWGGGTSLNSGSESGGGGPPTLKSVCVWGGGHMPPLAPRFLRLRHAVHDVLNNIH